MAARSYSTVAVSICALVAVIVVPAAASPHHMAQRKTWCVGDAKGCVSSVRAALARAHDGDTIKIAAGTFAGGFTIRKSVHLVGSGRSRTSIKGGGPVITIKARKGKEPTVSISSLTVRGGTATGNGYVSHGGGIDIPAGKDGDAGATVTLRHVTVRHNRATATNASPSPTDITCPHGFCPYAEADGGGISNSGNLTVVHSRVSDNKLNGPLSHAFGAGIYSEIGSLKVIASSITDNRAEPKVFGRFAEGGGMYVSGGLTVRRSIVSGNRVGLVTPFPIRAGRGIIYMYAQGGGIVMGDGEVRSTTIANNKVSAIDRDGEPFSTAAAVMATGNSHLSKVKIRNNALNAKVATTADVGPVGSAVYVDEGPTTIRDSSVVGNTVTVNSPHHMASANGGITVFGLALGPPQATVTNVTIARNSVLANTATGTAAVNGVGISNVSVISLSRVHIRHNIGRAQGPSTSAQGGGIWDSSTVYGNRASLFVRYSRISDNTVTTTPGGSAQGGGIYTTGNISRDHTAVAGNHPDQCVGC
jgi:hypothetical protein